METAALAKTALRKALIAECGLSRPQSYRIVDGKSVPSLRLAVSIEQKLGIAPGVWINGDPVAAMWERLKLA